MKASVCGLVVAVVAALAVCAECGVDLRGMKMGMPAPRSAFDAGCRVRAVSPLLKAALVLGVPGCATLVVILLQAMAERKRAAELKKLV